MQTERDETKRNEPTIQRSSLFDPSQHVTADKIVYDRCVINYMQDIHMII